MKKTVETDVYTDARRHHRRIPSVIPVDYQLLSAKQEPLDAEIRTAVTRDLSERGLCLNISRSAKKVLEDLQRKQDGELRIALDIRMPKRTLRVAGRIAWSHIELPQGRATIGIAFTDIADADGKAIASFARWAARRPKILWGTLGGLALALLVVGLALAWQVSLHRRAMGAVSQQIATANKKVGDMSGYMEDLGESLNALTQQSAALSEAEGVGCGSQPERSKRRADLEAVRASIAELQPTIAKLKAHQTSCFCWP